MSESSIEKTVKTFARERGFYVRKFSSPANRGVPDDIFISPKGKHFFVEFKAPGKEPTPLQLREARLIEKNKGTVYFIDDLRKGRETILSYL